MAQIRAGLTGGLVANLYWPKRSQFRSERTRRRRFEGKVEAAEAAARDALVVSHGGCMDGAGSAIMVLRCKGADRVGVVYTQPGDVQRVLAHLARFPGNGRTLHVTDLSLNPKHFDAVVAACRKLKEQDWRIEWRDHHEKQWEGIDLDRLKEHIDVLEVNQDHTESGASLVQKAVCPRDAYAKRLAATIRDRDLWWNKTGDSETLEFAMSELGVEKFVAHHLAQKGRHPVVDDEMQAAADRQRARIERDAQTLLKRTRYWETRDGEKVGVVYGWLPKNVGLHRVLEDDDVQLAVNVRPNGFMSLRSRKGADVSHLVARDFDGGGHPNASGGSLGLKGTRYWTYILSRGRIPRVRRVAEAAVRELEAREQA